MTDNELMTNKKQLILDAFAGGASWRKAAKAAGVTTMWIWRRSQSDEAFRAAIHAACSGPDAAVEATTYQCCLNPDPRHNVLRIFWLKSRMPDVYKDRFYQEHSGSMRLIKHSYVEGTIPVDPRLEYKDDESGDEA